MAAHLYGDLAERLEAARQSGKPAYVMCFLGPDPFELPTGMTAAQALDRARKALRRAAVETSMAGVDVAYYENLGCFAVRGPVAFVDALLAQPEIAGATRGDTPSPRAFLSSLAL